MMDDDKICERAKKCPLYAGLLESNKILIQTYKNLYCENGKESRAKCKRFQVAVRVGTCPPDILPNSTISTDDIIRQMEIKQ